MISEKIQNVFQNNEKKSCIQDLTKNFIKAQKDKLSTFFRSNIVYKIECSNCEASYVGQTGCLLKTRIDKHHINRNSNQRSVITERRIWNTISIETTSRF